jgi:hypothetical protein
MIELRRRDDGHEELNLPMDTCLDTPVYRDAYRDLIKSKSCKNVTYQTFLQRMHERNIARRKLEFNKRRMVIDRNSSLYGAFQETLKAGNSGKN